MLEKDDIEIVVDDDDELEVEVGMVIAKKNDDLEYVVILLDNSLNTEDDEMGCVLIIENAIDGVEVEVAVGVLENDVNE